MHILELPCILGMVCWGCLHLWHLYCQVCALPSLKSCFYDGFALAMSMLLLLETCGGISRLVFTNHGAGVQFITVFLGSFIAGSVLNQARALINNPTMIFSTLGTAAPLTSIFFLTWIELNVSTPQLSCNCEECHEGTISDASAVLQCMEMCSQDTVPVHICMSWQQ